MGGMGMGGLGMGGMGMMNPMMMVSPVFLIFTLLTVPNCPLSFRCFRFRH